ncbi:MAG: Yae1 family protein [Bacteriovoracaceae bacterium]
MRSQRCLAVLATLSLLGLNVACSDKYQEGFDKGKQEGYTQGKQEGYSQGYDVGYDDGYDDGYADGDAAGYARGDADGLARAQTYFASADYNAGFTDGKAQGVTLGYSQGYNVGKTDGYNVGKTDGYNTGKTDGYNAGVTAGYSTGYNAGKTDGYNSGASAGYSSGYSVGYDDGYDDGKVAGGSTTNYNAGYNAGYNDGYDDGAATVNTASYNSGYSAGTSYGYDIGYDDGFSSGYDVGYDDGYYALSLGATKQLRGYSNLLSMAHNDLIDYSKIKVPRDTKKGLVVDGRLLFSESSLTNKDTLKRAAIAEQFIVGQMASQVKGKMGLSAERSLKIAKAANHFRKYASKRALTEEDTNAYAVEIMGVNFKAIEKAYDASLKGDATGFQSVLERAAEKNETSPEKMTEIVTKLFI